MSRALVIVSLLAGTATAQPAPTAASVLASVQTYYANAKQLTAEFRQKVGHAAYGMMQNSDGRVWIGKPALFRFDYLKKGGVTAKTFAFDGTTGWYVDHGNQKITKAAAATGLLPAAVSFLTGGKQLAQNFTAALNTSGTYGGKGATVLELTPKQTSAQFSKLYLVVAANGHVTESIVIASNGDTNDIAFYKADTTTAVASSVFVIDPRSFPHYSVETAP